MKKILIVGSHGMLATDFIKYFGNNFAIYGFGKKDLNIIDIDAIEKKVIDIKPNIVLNFAAYTNVEDAEDVDMKLNYDVNAIGTYNLAKVSKNYGFDLITISTDYVFDGKKKEGYQEKDSPNPTNQYGMAKYIGEQLALAENPEIIIVRTSWLYGGGEKFKNFVNVMLKKIGRIKIISNQFGSPTYTKDLSGAIVDVIGNIDNYRGKFLHFSNDVHGKGISWCDFANEIFQISGKKTIVDKCNSEEFIFKAVRPQYSQLINNSDIQLRDWKDALRDYLGSFNY